MSEKSPDTQIEALVGVSEKCQDIEVVLGKILHENDFDVIATVKDARDEKTGSAIDLEWPTVLPEDDQKFLIGKGAVVDVVKAHTQMHNLIAGGAKQQVRQNRRTYEPRFLLSDEAYVLTPAQAWRRKLIGESAISAADKNAELEKSEMITVGQALDPQMGEQGFVAYVESETEQLLEELVSGRYPVESDYAETVLASLPDVASITASQIYGKLKALEPSVVDGGTFMLDTLSAGLRVFVESSSDVSKDIYTQDNVNLQLAKHLSDLGISRSDYLYAVFNFANQDQTPLDISKLADIMRLYRPDEMIGTRLYMVPKIGEIATVIPGYNKFGRNLSVDAPRSAETTPAPRPVFDNLDTWSEDIRYIKNREALSPEASYFVTYVEDIIGRGKVTLADLGTKQEELVIAPGRHGVPLAEIEKQQQERDSRVVDYRNAPLVTSEETAETIEIDETPIVTPVEANSTETVEIESEDEPVVPRLEMPEMPSQTPESDQAATSEDDEARSAQVLAEIESEILGNARNSTSGDDAPLSGDFDDIPEESKDDDSDDDNPSDHPGQNPIQRGW